MSTLSRDAFREFSIRPGLQFPELGFGLCEIADALRALAGAMGNPGYVPDVHFTPDSGSVASRVPGQEPPALYEAVFFVGEQKLIGKIVTLAEARDMGAAHLRQLAEDQALGLAPGYRMELGFAGGRTWVVGSQRDLDEILG